MLLQYILRISDYTRTSDCAGDTNFKIAYSCFWGLNQAQAILALMRQQRRLLLHLAANEAGLYMRHCNTCVNPTQVMRAATHKHFYQNHS
jgi:hypothetical protein